MRRRRIGYLNNYLITIKFQIFKNHHKRDEMRKNRGSDDDDDDVGGITDSTTDGDAFVIALLLDDGCCWCSLRVCFFRSKLRQKPLPQIRQVN